MLRDLHVQTSPSCSNWRANSALSCLPSARTSVKSTCSLCSLRTASSAVVMMFTRYLMMFTPFVVFGEEPNVSNCCPAGVLIRCIRCDFGELLPAFAASPVNRPASSAASPVNWFTSFAASPAT